jgi:hypothetical protein
MDSHIATHEYSISRYNEKRLDQLVRKEKAKEEKKKNDQFINSDPFIDDEESKIVQVSKPKVIKKIIQKPQVDHNVFVFIFENLNKLYYYQNRDRILAQRAQYYLRNKARNNKKCSEYHKGYYQQYKPEILQKNRDRRQELRDRL